MARLEDNYTRYPRPILWLVREGTVTLGGAGASSVPVHVASFYLSKLPVTNLQYEAYDETYERALGSPGDDDPAVDVSFDDAAGYCAWYAKVSRKPMRLPTEIEWEFACRAGSTSRWFFGDAAEKAGAYVWSRENSGKTVPALRAAKPNASGLQCMLGGVWEWTASLHLSSPGAADDGSNDRAGIGPRVLRGGSYRVALEELDAGLRRAAEPGTRCDDIGFRLARSL